MVFGIAGDILGSNREACYLRTTKRKRTSEGSDYA